MLSKSLAVLLMSCIFILPTGCSAYNSPSTEVNKNVEGIEQNKGQQDEWLYPAYIKQDNVNKWGYINKVGKFVIEPSYECTYDFESNGLAIIKNNQLFGLINKDGKILVEPTYNSVSYVGENLFSASDGEYSKLINNKGQIIYEIHGTISTFNNGFSVIKCKISNTTFEYGYIDSTGKVAIEPQFSTAQNFNEEKALVKTKDGSYALINKSGEIILPINYKGVRQFTEGTILFSDNKTNKYGYLKDDGNVLQEPKYVDAKPFKDGYAIVNDSNELLKKTVGIINKNGEFVINPQYGMIRNLGEGLYAVGNTALTSSTDWYIPKAIINIEGKQLTNYIYYDISNISNNLISVSDDKFSYFVDKSGEVVKNLPNVSGNGTLNIMGDLIKAQIDNELMYVDKNGNVVWKADNSFTFKNGIKVNCLKYHPDRSIIVYYPEVEGISNKTVEEKINSFLKDKFVGNSRKTEIEEGMFLSSIDTKFNADFNKKLLKVEYNSYYYPVGAAHGQPYKQYYHIDIDTGKTYALADLFKDGSDYIKILSDIVAKQIEEKSQQKGSMIWKESYKGISSEQSFIINKDTLQLYFSPYEIGPYAAGFITFDIPYNEIKDIINTDGELWKSFDKNLMN